MSDAFPVHEFSFTSLATGLSARDLEELRERVRAAPEESLVFHFWGGLMRADERPGAFGNDLGEWAATRLHDRVVAERLALVDPSTLDPVALRAALVAVLELRLSETGGGGYRVAPEDAFHFVRPQFVVYETGEVLERPADLLDVLDRLPDTSLFLHFADPTGLAGDDGPSLGGWLRDRDEEGLADALESLDPFLLSTAELRDRLTGLVHRHLGFRETTP